MANAIQYFKEHIHEMEGKVLHNWTPRMLGNGINYNDLQAINSKMRGWQDWGDLFTEYAEIHRTLADEALAAGHELTAGEAYRRCAMYYHFGSFMLFDKPEQRLEMKARCMKNYETALKYLEYKGVKVEIPFQDGKTIPAYYRESPTANGRIVFVVPGADATKEESSFYDEIFLSRGISTLTWDGPGQGECQSRGIYFRKETYDAAYKCAVKYMKETLGYTKLGSFGISLGGYLAPRAAAVCPDDFTAAIGVSGPFKNREFAASGPMFPADFACVFGEEDIDKLEELNRNINFADVVGNIKCDLLIYHGTADHIVPPEMGQMIVDGAVNARSRQLILIPGANHVCNSHSYIFRPGAGDFMVDHLK